MNLHRHTSLILTWMVIIVAVILVSPGEIGRKEILFHAAVAAGWMAVTFLAYRRRMLSAAVLGFIMFTVYHAAEVQTFGPLKTFPLLVYALISVTLALIFVLLRQPERRWLRGIGTVVGVMVIIAATVVPAVVLLYRLQFGQPFSRTELFAILQSNLGEATGFISTFADWHILLIPSVALVGMILLFVHQPPGRMPKRFLPPALLLVILCVAISLQYRDQLRLPQFIEENHALYHEELERFRAVQARYVGDEQRIVASKDGHDETWIVLIGESLNRDHMGLYGYHRPTTPRLSQRHRAGELLVFEQPYAIHTHTAPVFERAFTAANQHNRERFFRMPSVIGVLNAAGVRTAWISNQIRYGPWDNIVSVMAERADTVMFLNDYIGATTYTKVRDEAVIDPVRRLLNTPHRGSRVLFVHLMGNHHPYCIRYPDTYDRWRGGLPLREFGALAQNAERAREINCYDNSVLYNDAIVDGLIRLLEKRPDAAGLLYTSDHADDVDAGVGHVAGRFTFSMTRIPLLLWTSEHWRAQYSDAYRRLRQRRSRVFANDFLFDTMLGLFGVRTPLRDTTGDLSGEDFSLRLGELSTLHGAKAFLAPENVPYHQRRALHALHDADQAARILPHRVNTLGMLRQLLRDGGSSFECDLMIVREDDSCRFDVGHDAGTMAGMSLWEMLSNVERWRVREGIAGPGKIWLDVKNLNAGNVDAALRRLRQLDRRFNLRERIIVETGWTGREAALLADAGFHTSYYLPTDDLLAIWQSGSEVKRKRRARDIAAQVRQQRMAAVSFDHRLYPFVTQVLEPLLPERIVYHTWLPGPRLRDPDFIDTMRKISSFHDARVRTILVPYASPYAL